MEMSFLRKELLWYEQMLQGKQKELMRQIIHDAKDVVVDSINDVFTKEEIKKIKKVVRPKAKECYKNAFLLTQLFPEKVMYVEGKMSCFKSISLEHAWNKVGDKYVDITMELVLKKNPKDEEYMSLGCYEYKEILDVAVKLGYYGEVYFNKNINKTHTMLSK